MTNGTLDLRGLLHAILTCVTAGPGLRFNRAVLFLADDDSTQLAAAMAIGPATREEAYATWAKLASEHKPLDELVQKPADGDKKSGFQALVEGLAISLEGAGASGNSPSSRSGEGAAASPAPRCNPLVEAYRTRRTVKIVDAASLGSIPQRLRDVFAGTEVVCVPLVAKERSLGLIVADNAFSDEPLEEGRIHLLQLFALLAGLALDNARIYKQIERQARQLTETLDELKVTHEQLIHSERLATVGAVVARVSHEIRNPLTTIGGFARTLSAHPDDTARVARNADIIVEEVEKLESLLKEMLDFTAPKQPAVERTDLNRAINALATVHLGELSERHVELVLQLAQDLPLVLADRNQMQRVFLNLWQNALQAMEEAPAGRARTLTVRTWRNGRTVKVAFSDTGNGIAATALPHIFTPFFTTKRRGTGLGLAVVKKIIDDHEGRIDADNEPTSGATFLITLPITR